MTVVESEFIKRKIVAECEDDYVGLWVIVRALQMKGVSDDCLIEWSIKLIRSIVEGSNIRLGQFDGVDFIFWVEDLETSLIRIRTEWEALGKLPNLGEIVWLVDLAL